MRTKKHWKKLKDKEFRSLKLMTEVASLSKISQVTGRGSSTLFYIKNSADYADYLKKMKEKNAATLARSQARSKANGFEVGGDQASLTQLDRIEHELRHIRQDLQALARALPSGSGAGGAMTSNGMRTL